MNGIYKVTNIKNGKIYIGESKDIKTRWKQETTLDSAFYADYKKDPDAFTFDIIDQCDTYTADQRHIYEALWINYFQSNINGYNRNAGHIHFLTEAQQGNLLGVEVCDDKKDRNKMRPVQKDLAKKLYINYIRELTLLGGKKILIIGDFTFNETLAYTNDVTIIIDNEAYNCSSANRIIRAENKKIVEVVKNMDEQFDLIIANPPYNIGNQIISNVIDKAKESIVLMPLACYKPNELYKYVNQLERVNPESFDDALITDNLSIASLNNKKFIDQSYADLELLTFDQEYLNYYKLNNSKNTSNIFESCTTEKAKAKCDVATTFVVGTRVCQNSVHKTENCFDYHYNILKENIGLPPVSWALYFDSQNKKNNFTKFWYNNKVFASLLSGLHKKSGTPQPAIPNIDFSKDRPYETATLEDLMNWIKEDNQNS